MPSQAHLIRIVMAMPALKASDIGNTTDKMSVMRYKNPVSLAESRFMAAYQTVCRASP
jgi:hypothetical protein